MINIKKITSIRSQYMKPFRIVSVSNTRNYINCVQTNEFWFV